MIVPTSEGPGEGRRVLIVNADDLGMSRGVNTGIVEAHERGIVTSASLMVRRGGVEHAARVVERIPGLSVGLHVDLGEWELREGGWSVRERVVDAEDREAVEREVEAQLERFLRLIGREPTHLDSHQHVHLQEPARSVVRAHGMRLGVPVRGLTELIVPRGDFYARGRGGAPCPEAIGVERLVRIITTLPTGVTELGCHPGHPEGLDDPYGPEREIELRSLCDPRVQAAVEQSGVALRSYPRMSVGEEAAWSPR